MNWQDIKVSADNTHFIHNDLPIFGKKYFEVLKFHSPGLAPVRDETGSYHIDVYGNQLYSNRFFRTFGFYCNRAAVVDLDEFFHINEKGVRAYSRSYSWTGNYQENFCPVREGANFLHIGLDGSPIYERKFAYCGDFKDSIACVKMHDGGFRHIDPKGSFIHSGVFLQLGIFHKNYAIAKDEKGWFHIDKNGAEIYSDRYSDIEPFYNGFSLVSTLDGTLKIIDESGRVSKLL